MDGWMDEIIRHIAIFRSTLSVLHSVSRCCVSEARIFARRHANLPLIKSAANRASTSRFPVEKIMLSRLAPLRLPLSSPLSYSTRTLGTTAKQKKTTTLSLNAKRRRSQPITMVTAYDYPSAVHVDRADMDIILVGDSVAMVELGMETTQPVGSPSYSIYPVTY